MFCCNREEAMKYYNKVISIVSTALEAALYLPEKTEDPDMIDYFRCLREHLLECITCIIHCLREIERMDLFDQYSFPVLEFATKIGEDRYEPTLV